MLMGGRVNFMCLVCIDMYSVFFELSELIESEIGIRVYYLG